MRNSYLDLLKGFAIFTVIIYHMGLGREHIMQYFINVQMPIFFIVSGFLSYKRIDSYKPIENTIKRFKQLFLPLIFSGIAISKYNNVNYIDYLFHDGKLGYWFLLTLLEIVCLYNLTYYKREKLPLKYSCSIDIICIIFLIAFRYVMPENIIDMFGLRQLAKFYPVFITGVYLRKYTIIIEKIEKHNYIFIVLLVYCFLFQQDNSNKLLYYIDQVVSSIINATFMFYLFKKYENSIPFSNKLQYIGRNSLSIYIVHFFLLFKASDVYVSDYFAVNLILSVVLSGSVILSSLIISKIIEAIPLLSLLLLGQKK